ncbi:D-alanyl-D-alanine carboxypeptidase family protein [Actinoplanes sp. NPDC026623]|uniref:M15 family metallopeptidase n=1 Tax=Actinoplanes sp. NPDC026623 TaxID=3155610 RepID=UPI0033C6D600
MAITAVLMTCLAVAGLPGSASAQVPTAASRWSSLMYHSLTPTPAYVQLRTRLASQRVTLKARAGRVTTRKAAHVAAQTAMTNAVTADAGTRTRYAMAREALLSARYRLTVAGQQRPRSGAAVTEANMAVTAAAKTAGIRRGQAREAAAALKAAQTAAATATVEVDKAVADWQTSQTAVQANQRKLIALDKSAELAAQAAATSRDVVTDVRARFAAADTTTVNGITVHRSVAFAFRRMLADAKSDGIALSGGGFRTRKRQIELRKINGCPDVYTAPASSCRVPTAIPGRSLHELGLAVDITSGGRTIAADSAAFRWLSTHAHKYGYVNLPSEPWHWSISGS